MTRKGSKAGKDLRRVTKPVAAAIGADFPVMKAQCSTCPFRTDELGRFLCPDVALSVQKRVLNHASQLCHHPTLHGHKETHLCRGARDFQQTIFHRMGVIDAPTDEAWEKKRREMEKRAAR